MKRFLFILLAVLVSLPLFSDVLIMKNGSKIYGSIREKFEGSIYIMTSSGIRSIDESSVAEVIYGVNDPAVSGNNSSTNNNSYTENTTSETNESGDYSSYEIVDDSVEKRDSAKVWFIAGTSLFSVGVVYTTIASVLFIAPVALYASGNYYHPLVIFAATIIDFGDQEMVNGLIAAAVVGPIALVAGLAVMIVNGILWSMYDKRVTLVMEQGAGGGDSMLLGLSFKL